MLRRLSANNFDFWAWDAQLKLHLVMRMLRIQWRHTRARGLATSADAGVSSSTPAMQQYWGMRGDAQYAGCMLLYQMGQFMECFFDDARVLSNVLGVTCTHRGTHHGARIPMAGVPIFTHDAHVARLVRAGYRVAICEQLDGLRRDAATAGEGGIMQRGVQRVATRGTMYDSAALRPRSHNFLVAVSAPAADDSVGVAWTDVSTGEAHIRSVPRQQLPTLLVAINPVELVIPLSQSIVQPRPGSGPDGASPHDALYRCMHRATRDALKLRSVVQADEVTRMTARMTRPCISLSLPGMDASHTCTIAAWPAEHFTHAGSGADVETAAAAGLQSYVSWALRDAAPVISNAVRSPWQAATAQPGATREVMPLLRMDAATRRSLEITRPMHGRRRARGSLLHACDSCVTAMGARLMDSRVCHPVADVAVINARLDAVAWMTARPDLLHALRRHLAGMPDVERSLQRVKMGKYSVDDMLALRAAMVTARRMAAMLQTQDIVTFAPIAEPQETAAVQGVLVDGQAAVAAAWRCADGFYDASEDVVATCTRALAAPLQVVGAGADPLYVHCATAMHELQRALCDATSGGLRSTGMIQPGFSTSLDDWRRLRDDSEGEVAALQQRLRDETGVAVLRLRRLEDVGLVVEVPTRAHGDIAKAIAAQTVTDASLALRSIRSTKAASRFSCDAVTQLDQKISRAAAQVAAEESDIMRQLVRHVCDAAHAISAVVRAIAVLDVASACATNALTHSLVRPVLVRSDDPRAPFMHVTAGRHMVVERALLEAWAVAPSDGSAGMETAAGDDDEDGQDVAATTMIATSGAASARAFVPNDVRLGDDAARCVVLAGANMGGKSTYLRQIAHIVILAQMGSFVPADSATLSVVDALFTRIGAADDVTRDRSTFLVEMEEAAHILQHASADSLVLVDEVGRGTSTLDGLALAWSILEHFVRVTRCRTVFATHMHELTAAAVHSSGGGTSQLVSCMTMHAHEDDADGPVLTHRLTPHPLYAAVKASADVRDAAWVKAVTASHGVHVARMAGVPSPVLNRAQSILQQLNDTHAANAWVHAVAQLELLAPTGNKLH